MPKGESVATAQRFRADKARFDVLKCEMGTICTYAMFSVNPNLVLRKNDDFPYASSERARQLVRARAGLEAF
jgi:hypothetical protein